MRNIVLAFAVLIALTAASVFAFKEYSWNYQEKPRLLEILSSTEEIEIEYEVTPSFESLIQKANIEGVIIFTPTMLNESEANVFNNEEIEIAVSNYNPDISAEQQFRELLAALSVSPENISKSKTKQEREHARTAVERRSSLFNAREADQSLQIDRIAFIEDNSSHRMVLYGNDQRIQGMITNLDMSDKRDFSLFNRGQDETLFWHIASAIKFGDDS